MVDIVTTSGLFNPQTFGSMGPQMAYDKRWEAILRLSYLYEMREPNQDYIIRELFPTDLGISTEEWSETSGADNSLTTTSIAGGSTYKIAQDVYAVIVGIRNFTPAVVTPIVPEWRISVGGQMRARWSTLESWYVQDPDAAEAQNFVPINLLAWEPVFMESQDEIKVEEYNNVGTTAYKIAIEGYVAENVGRKLNL